MQRSILSIVLIATLVAVAGCKRRNPLPEPQANVSTAVAGEASPVVHGDAPPGINWFSDSVEAAFAKAAAEDKPVFLYWAAVWCPYCKDLKAHVFSRADFKEKLRLFVPVYLDGDDEGAQKWGEEFGVTGYPAVLILKADRLELARIAGGMDLSLYAEVLDLVLGDERPVKDLLASLQTHEKPLSPDDCRRLAYNAWALEDHAAGEGKETSVALMRAAERCPQNAKVEKARLSANAAFIAATAEIESLKAGKPVSPQLAELVRDVRAIVDNRELAVASADALQILDEKFFQAVKGAEPKLIEQWMQKWSAVMDAVADDARYSAGDRLAATRAKLRAVKVLHPSGKIPEPLMTDALRRVDQALSAKHDASARAAVVNAALNVMNTLDQPRRAYAIAEAEMKTSKTPYYYMADLATFEEKLGRKNEALSWYERAYRESKGAATRFQWGANYLNALIRLAPEDEARIQKAALEVLGELDGPDRLYKRTRIRLEQLEANLRRWNAEGGHSQAIAAIRTHMSGICGKIPPAEPARETCGKFLVEA